MATKGQSGWSHGVYRPPCAELWVYNRTMGRALLACLLAAAWLWGQPDRKTAAILENTLSALQDASVDRTSMTKQFADEMMAGASNDRKPSRSTVELFADKFVRAMRGRKIPKPQLVALQNSLTQMLDGTHPNSNSASRFREVLTVLNIDSSVREELTARFIAVGEDIRGPDDLPVRDRSKK